MASTAAAAAADDAMEVDTGAGAAPSAAQEALDSAVDLESLQPEQAVSSYRRLIFDTPATEEWKVKEQALRRLTDLLVSQHRVNDLRTLLSDLRPLFNDLPKAKTAKIVRTTLDLMNNIPGATDAQIELCQDWIAWCKQEKRSFLRQRIEITLAQKFLERRRFQDALDIVGALAHEVKRQDDKIVLVEVYLEESLIYYALKNVARARASLTAARTNANSIYCPPPLQAAIDMQAGTLYAEELDYKTAYSYFFEALDNFTTMGERTRGLAALKYMLLCKIMTDAADEVSGIITSRPDYAGRGLDAMRAVAQAYQNRALQEFQTALAQYPAELKDDPLIQSHLHNLYENLLEQNLCRIVEPFSRVEIAHVAALIQLPVDAVETKLSQMILDKKFNGVLDQGSGCLLVNTDVARDGTYTAAVDTLKNVGHVVESLFVKCKAL